MDLMKTHGIRKAFFKGSNSTCRVHIRSHFEVYQAQCKEQDIDVYFRVMMSKLMTCEGNARDSKVRAQNTSNAH